MLKYFFQNFKRMIAFHGLFIFCNIAIFFSALFFNADGRILNIIACIYPLFLLYSFIAWSVKALHSQR